MRDSCGETDQEMVREKIIQGQNITKEYNQNVTQNGIVRTKGVTEEQF